MAEQPTDDERRAWHRRFAIEGNNRSWALVERAELSAAERDELLHTAYSSWHHWTHVGNDRNDALAALLLAFVHARLGHAEPARMNAAKAAAFFDTHPAEPWERAFVEAGLASAACVSGDTKSHARHHANAVEIANSLDAEDRNIFMAAFSRVPLP